MSHRRRALLAALFVFTLSFAVPARAADLVALNPENFDAYAPHGTKAEAIYGDYVLRNDQIVAAVGNNEIITGRSGSRMSPMHHGGCIIDFTLLRGPGSQNDQLAAFVPGPRMINGWSDFQNGTAHYVFDYAKAFQAQSGRRVTLTLIHHPRHPELFTGEVQYILEDGWHYVLNEVTYRNPAGGPRPPAARRIPLKTPPGDAGGTIEDLMVKTPETEKAIPNPDEAELPSTPEPVNVSPWSELTSDAVVERGSDAAQHLVWMYDAWFGQAYAIVEDPTWIHRDAKGQEKPIDMKAGSVTLLPGESLKASRRVIAGRNAFDVRSIANDLLKVPQHHVSLLVTGPDAPAAGAEVAAYHLDRDEHAMHYASGRTDDKGMLEFDLPGGPVELRIKSLGRGSTTLHIDPAKQHELRADLASAGIASVEITDEEGKTIPCKIEFRGHGTTPDPEFFSVNGERLVKNLCYSETGRCRQVIPPGQYQVIITRGPAYDAITQEISVEPGKEAAITGKLNRVVDTHGWISTDLHSFTIVSGRPHSCEPSAASQLGRVLNLICEDVQFAPTTEYDIVSTWEPFIHELHAEAWLKTCPGIALAAGGRKYSYNEQYAFPIEYKPHWQDGGAPQRPQHCGQIEWMQSWGAPINVETPWATAGKKGYEKLTVLMQRDNKPATAQLNVPMSSMFRDRDVPAWWNDDSAWTRPMFRDTNDDGVLDRVHHNFATTMDALDVRTLRSLIDPAAKLENDVADWLLMRKAGYRMTGLINSGAATNFHGSGGVRNYVLLNAKSVADIQPLDVVHAVKAGHVMMTTGPFLEATLKTTEGATALPGDLIPTHAAEAQLHLRVQCPNWITLDRVYVLRNGEPDPKLDFSRKNAPDRFTAAPVAFDQTIAVPLPQDTQFLVIATGHGPNLRERRGPHDDVTGHVAVANPILVDVGGDGFVPQSPVADNVEAFLRVARPVRSAEKSPPGLIHLTLINHGDTTAQGTVHFYLKQNKVLRILGKDEAPFKIAAGDKAHVDIELGLTPDAQAEALMTTNETKLSSVLFVPRMVSPPGVAPARLPIVVDDEAKPMELDPKDLMSVPVFDAK